MMDKLTRFIDFVRYVLAAWRKTFGASYREKPGDSGQTTAEQMDQEAWEAAKKKYKESMKQSDRDFWEGEK